MERKIGGRDASPESGCMVLNLVLLIALVHNKFPSFQGRVGKANVTACVRTPDQTNHSPLFTRTATARYFPPADMPSQAFCDYHRQCCLFVIRCLRNPIQGRTCKNDVSSKRR